MSDPTELSRLYPEYDELAPGQQRILEAALELFAERGFASTSTGAIARQAGVAEGLIFKHFRSKKELFLKLVRPLALDVFFPITALRMKKLLEQDYSQLAELMEAILRERLAFATAHRRLLRLMVQEFWLHQELRDDLYLRFREQLQPYIMYQFEHFSALGQIRPMRFEAFLRLMISTHMGYILARVMLFPDSGWDDEAEIRDSVRFVVQGLSG